ncbi:MAG: toxin-antitoxin system TumE family protein [Candidatus Helarchaeota archaeon]
MKAIEKLQIAKDVLEDRLKLRIMALTLNRNLERLRLTLKDGTIIFIQYNNYNEYSYSIIFSNSEYDRIRFDNYDKGWNVTSKPHHYHPRKEKVGKNSPMSGNPTQDMLILSKMIESGKF